MLPDPAITDSERLRDRYTGLELVAHSVSIGADDWLLTSVPSASPFVAYDDGTRLDLAGRAFSAFRQDSSRSIACRGMTVG